MDLENNPPGEESVHLPQELIEEILSALPARSLLRFKCVSKSWRSLIGSERFIKTQLEKSIKDPSYAHWRVAFNSEFDFHLKKYSGLTQCSARTYLDEEEHDIFGSPSDYRTIHRRPFDDSTNNHLTTPGCRVVGHCNGLLCVLKKSESTGLYLWNPTTRMSIELCKQDLPIDKYGFGVDVNSGAYKVFAAFSSGHEGYIGKVYSSETKSWKTVEHGWVDPDNPRAGVLVGGKLHWLRPDGHYIESFDLSSEVFEMIEVPEAEGEPGESKDLFLGVVKRRLTVTMFYRSHDDDDDDDDDFAGSGERLEDWVRVRVTEGGVKEHWVKVETERDEEEELEDIVDGYGDKVYVESLVWPVHLKNL